MPTQGRTIDINPTPFFVPPRVGGDREFKGHGPRVRVSATLSVRNANELWTTLFMNEKETTRDKTGDGPSISSRSRWSRRRSSGHGSVLKRYM